MGLMRMGVGVLAVSLTGMLVVPLVWIGIGILPFAVLPVATLLGALRFARVWRGWQHEPSRRVEVLLIDEELETGRMVEDVLGGVCSVHFVASSLHGVDDLLAHRDRGQHLDMVAIRWTRPCLPREEVLDYLDRMLEKRRLSGGLHRGSSVGLPPVLFLRKPGAAPFVLRRSHEIPVLGCVALDRRTLRNDVRRHVR